MTDSVRERLTTFARRVSDRLAERFERWRAEVPIGEAPPAPTDLFDAVVDLTLRGGKRLRPALAYHAALCVTDDLDEDVLFDAALSLELLQSALLIHDDIMDQDDERRGGTTVHLTMARQTGDGHLGVAYGILAGSLALALAQRILGECHLSAGARASAGDELARMQTEVIYGQHLDLSGGACPHVVQSLKTSSYTTRGPVRFGARIAGASPAQIEALTAYANPLGRAFQTRDDLLGTFGDPKRLGKPVGADLRAGRETELLSLARARATAIDKATIDRVIGDFGASNEAVADAVMAIDRTGAKRDLEDLIALRTAEAIAALDGAPVLDRGRDFLRGVARLLADRVS